MKPNNPKYLSNRKLVESGKYIVDKYVVSGVRHESPKPGDDVWVFTGQNIEHFIVDSIDGDVVRGFLGSGVSIRLLLPYPVFPTREALCEHYRKIFK